MGTSSQAAFRFNGVVSTDQTVMQNLETMCNAAGSWLTYDSLRGQWAVIINQPGTSRASFDDTNILGSITLSRTGLEELYNSVRVNFPHVDLNDVRDFVRYEIPSGDRFPGEPDSELVLEYDIFNDPVQADLLAIRQLKQSRMDLVIRFTSDYSRLGLVAGDIIDVTSPMYGFDQRLFRITSIAETDSDDGNILLDITALEYSDSVYDLSDLERYTRSDLNGIGSIGDIGAPSTPSITVFAVDARPRVVVTTLVPGNAPVDRMELWYSINNSTFELVSTQSPTGGAGVWSIADTVTFEHVPPDTGTIYYRVRAGNSNTRGDFSATASAVYNPVQVTDAINEDTQLLEDGSPLSLLLGLPEILNALDQFLDGNASSMQNVQQSVTATVDVSAATFNTKYAAMTATTDPYRVYDPANLDNRSNWVTSSITVPSGWSVLEVQVRTPTGGIFYDYLDQDAVQRTGAIAAQPALEIAIYFGSDLATATKVTETTIDWNNNNQFISVSNPAAGTYWCILRAIPTYDLSMYWPRTSPLGAVSPQELYLYNVNVITPTSFRYQVRTE